MPLTGQKIAEEMKNDAIVAIYQMAEQVEDLDDLQSFASITEEILGGLMPEGEPDIENKDESIKRLTLVSIAHKTHAAVMGAMAQSLFVPATPSKIATKMAKEIEENINMMSIFVNTQESKK